MPLAKYHHPESKITYHFLFIDGRQGKDSQESTQIARSQGKGQWERLEYLGIGAAR